MKKFTKKSISLVLILAVLMVAILPSMVAAVSVGTVGSRVKFVKSATDSEEVESSTNMEEYINS